MQGAFLDFSYIGRYIISPIPWIVIIIHYFCAVISGVLLISAFTLKKKKQKPQSKRKLWVRKWISRRDEGKGVLSMLNHELLNEDPSSYRNFLRLSHDSFEKLLKLVEPQLTKKCTFMRDCLSVRSK